MEQARSLSLGDPGRLTSLVAARPSAAEPLLLLPGTLCDERLWHPVLRHLPGQPVTMAEMDGALTAPDLAARILSGAPPRFALAGFSLGGIVALEMAAQAPERITRLALVSTTPRPDPESNHAARRTAVARAKALGLERFIADELWPRYVGAASRDDGDLKALICGMATSLGLEAFAAQSEVAIHRADSRPRLSRIQVPTLVLAGAEDRLCPPEVQREMAAAIPDADLVLVPGSGHFVLLEEAEVAARHLRAWLDLPPSLNHHESEAP